MFNRLKQNMTHNSKGIALISTLIIGSLTAFSVSAAPLPILETGSTLLYPLFNLQVPVYTKKVPGVQITTQGTGSGTGIAEAISGVAQLGASDAYMSDAQIRMHPDILNIPVAVSIQMINYNLPGLNQDHLKLSGPVLAGIYNGSITNWDSPAIAKLNPGIKFPNHRIIPVHRTDGSGDTFIFSQYLAFSTPQWSQGVGYGTTISWPAVSGGIGAEGNPGMVQALKAEPYSIAYVGISWMKPIEKARLGIAMLQNRDGKFVLPTIMNAKAALSQRIKNTPADERISLVFAPGAHSYPIINFEYVIVSKNQPNPQLAAAIRNFLNWEVDPHGGSATHFMKAVSFVPLPQSAVMLSKKQIAEIH
ncbi:MAG: phosphate ABC transporter substrate-binding protein PstS [Proteobacteria bacterium]|nr:phosphate ABC transporter substrate-binding protein PstS [Pseudomonadota bacterium]